MNTPSSRHRIIKFICRATLVIAGTLVFAISSFGQETGGELGGGAGIFRPKNPEAKRSSGPPKPVRPRMSPAEIEAGFQDALAEGNEARDERKFAPAEAAYRRALTVKPHDARSGARDPPSCAGAALQEARGACSGAVEGSAGSARPECKPGVPAEYPGARRRPSVRIPSLLLQEPWIRYGAGL